jgi:DNA-binding MarR family transcriptional regulator
MSEAILNSDSSLVRRPAPSGEALKVLPPVTDRQGKCLIYILNYLIENRYYPTQRELALAMGVRSNTAEMYVQPLVAKGYLVREPGKQRNIRLTQEALERLKLLGVNVEERLAAA